MVKATNTCTQVITSQSIVITDGYKYWKYIIRELEAFRVQSLSSLIKSEHVLHYESLSVCPQLFVSTRMLGPLMPEDAKKCLFDFAGLVKQALNEIHGMNRAHLDVRLPNVCFRLTGEQCKAVLIDLDRMQPADKLFTPSFSGKYYKKPSGWMTKKLDWKQLGLTLEELVATEDGFLKELIDNGKLCVCVLSSCVMLICGGGSILQETVLLALMWAPK